MSTHSSVLFWKRVSLYRTTLCHRCDGQHYMVRAYTPRRHTAQSASSRTPVLVVLTPTHTMPQESGQIQHAGGNLTQSSIRNSLGNSAMSDVSTTDMVSFQETVSSGRPDANSLIFGAGGHEHALLRIEVNEWSRIGQTAQLATSPKMSFLLWNRALVLPCIIKLNNSNTLPDNINDLMQSSKHYWTLQLDLKRHCSRN